MDVIFYTWFVYSVITYIFKVNLSVSDLCAAVRVVSLKKSTNGFP